MPLPFVIFIGTGVRLMSPSAIAVIGKPMMIANSNRVIFFISFMVGLFSNGKGLKGFEGQQGGNTFNLSLFSSPFFLVFLGAQGGQAYVVLHGKHTGEEHRCTAKQQGNLGGSTQPVAYAEHNTAQHTCHCIYFLAEYKRFLIYEHVAYNTAGSTCHGTHDNGYPYCHAAVK